MGSNMKTLRIGAGAGYSGDRIEPAVELAERGGLDYLVFECLAERTIALAQQARLRDPEAGFDPLLAARLRAVLPICARNKVKIVTNMGAANPVGGGAGDARYRARNGPARPQGCSRHGRRRAAIGCARAKSRSTMAARLRRWATAVISANAYIGAGADRRGAAARRGRGHHRAGGGPSLCSWRR